MNENTMDEDGSDQESLLVWAPIEGTEFIFPDGTSNPPPELPPTNEELHKIPRGVLFVGLFFASIVLVLSIGLGIWTLKMRESRVVRSAQPEFLCLLCGGTFVMASSVIPMSFQEPMSQTGLNISCMADMWLFMVGFAVSFSALIAKMQRINQIFRVGNFKRVVVKPIDVMKPFFFHLITNFIVLTSWTVVAPLTYQRVAWSTDQFGRAVESYGTCTKLDDVNKVLPFVILLVIINLLCIFFANVQAYQARKIRTEFSESRYIAISMASILQAFVLGIPVLAAVSTSPNPSGLFLLKSALVTLVCLATLLPLFLPKIISAKKKPTVPTLQSSHPGMRLYNGMQQNAANMGSMAALSRREQPEVTFAASRQNLGYGIHTSTQHLSTLREGGMTTMTMGPSLDEGVGSGSGSGGLSDSSSKIVLMETLQRAVGNWLDGNNRAPEPQRFA